MEQLAATFKPVGFVESGPDATDFVDFGSKLGGSFHTAYRMGAKNGLGIDIRPKIVEQAQASGMNVILGDATKLDLPDKCVRFSILSHFLEHLPSLTEVRQSIKSAIRISTEAVYMAGPVFDDEQYLKSLGFKTYWSDWKGHPCHLTCSQVVEILKSLGVTLGQFKMCLHVPYRDSDSPFIHPLSSPVDQHDYDPSIHPHKASIEFNRTCYMEWRCIIYCDSKRREYPIMNELQGAWISYPTSPGPDKKGLWRYIKSRF
ncbi:MAG: methyltransferase domain-containing protein [Bdellovibrionales bacterium]|nr:methyltransferase domain-containing protein [Bdellovibrionales bacterium]